MQYTKEQAKGSVAKLVEAFKQRQINGLLKDYKEEQVKKDFILPLFGYLNWNIESDEVRAEYSVTRGEVDYAFNLNGAIKFFLEAKSVREGTEDQKYLRQAINYGYHRSITWVVLTDFKTLKLLNSEFKEQSLLSNVVLRLTTDDYIERFEELWLLSKNSFQEEILDKWAERLGKKSKRTPIDKQLLQNFTEWRAILTKDILVHNKTLKLNEEVLDEVVQRILDRLIFMRKTEDVGLEEKHLSNAQRDCEHAESQGLYRYIQKIFRKYDNDYDSELFSQHTADQVVITKKVLSSIIKGLYATEDGLISYNFADIPADVLGNIYEQYLGYILKKTKKGARIDQKLIIRKEQGIYYTPTFIVDFIVQHTVGELLRNQPQIKNIKVLDPACGSGSFLIKSFDVLNAWCKANNPSYSHTQILTENLFGVDLDQKAVEVAQLNLLLRSMEKKRLPMLKHNIKCGNSLIADNAIAGDKAFNWNKEFGNIMDVGGFDVVIGNPPYIMIEKIPKEVRPYLYSNYSIGKRFDLFQVFVEKAIALLRENGLLGFILPNTFLMGSSFKDFRKAILEKAHILQIVDLPQGIFEDVTVDNVILILQKKTSMKRPHNIIIKRMKTKSNPIQILENKWDIEFTIPQRIFLESKGYAFNINLDPVQKKMFDKMEEKSVRLGEITESSQGIIIYKTEEDSKAGKYTSFTKHDANWKRLLRGTNIGRYKITWGGEYIKYGRWLWSPREEKFFSEPKILLQAIRNKSLKRRLIGAYDEDGMYYNAHNLANIIAKDPKYPLLYILAIFNSKASNFWYKAHFPNVNINPNDFRQLPIPKDISDMDKSALTHLAEKMLSLNEELIQMSDKPTNKTVRIQEEIKKTDCEIDKIVYRLYGLSETEIKLVEGSFGNNP